MSWIDSQQKNPNENLSSNDYTINLLLLQFLAYIRWDPAIDGAICVLMLACIPPFGACCTARYCRCIRSTVIVITQGRQPNLDQITLLDL